MAERIEYTCDYCGAILHNKLPQGWYKLAYHKESFLDINDWRVTHHFCSLDCMDGAVKVTPKVDRR